jgi:hypothetical protein
VPEAPGGALGVQFSVGTAVIGGGARGRVDGKVLAGLWLSYTQK